MKKSILLSLLSLVSLQLNAQQSEAATVVAAAPPGSEILLFDIEQNAHGVLGLSVGKNITQHPGYDSQPRFSNEGGLLYYTRAVSNKVAAQMEIYQYDVKMGYTRPYLVTALSEYSPTPMINSPLLSVVQVDEQGDQYVVILNQQTTQDKQMQRYSDLKQVGYFNWTVGDVLWSFVLNDNKGGDLYRQINQDKAEKREENVGRSFITDSKREQLFYVSKNTTPWRINKIGSKQHKAEDVMALPMGVEDFTMDSKGRFWAGRDNTLFVSTDQRRWFIVAEFNDTELDQITRVTTNPNADKIAIVFAEKTNNE